MKINVIAAAVIALTGAGWAAAQTAAPATMAPASGARAGATTGAMPGTAPMAGDMRRNRGESRDAEKKELEQALQAGQSRADYAKIIEKSGYRISSINSDKPDYLEYEVVKGDHSYEVKLDFKDGAARATKIDVANNLWRTDATKRMLADSNYKAAGPLVADTEGRYSDRRYMKAYADEKEKLEKALTGPNMKVADIKGKIEQMGYKITSTNDKDKDYVEYEIVKGDNSYEVQVDLDSKTQTAKKVDVAENVWETDSTERAKGEKGAAAAAPGMAASRPMPATAMASGGMAANPRLTEGADVNRNRMAARNDASRNDEKDQLEQKLQAAQNRADYAKIIEQNGYRISSINADRKDYLEYEIVKGDHSYEVQLDFDNASPKATKVDVTNNLWRTDATKRMLADSNYKAAGPLVADPEGRYSDRRYMKAYNDEKEKLEKALTGPNMKPADIKSKLEQMGYKITSTNDKDKDYLEYEIVKGDNSYEVQVDLDSKTQTAKKVDVAENVWETDSTERAKGEKK